MLERNSYNLKIIENEAKQRIRAMDTHDSDYVTTCTTEISSISNNLKKLLLQSDLHLSYTKIINNGKQESIHKIFSKYDEPLLNAINDLALVQEWKLNIDAAEYEKN